MMLALTFWSGVLGLAFVMLPGVFPQFVLGGTALCLGILGLHYFVWGRWMRKILQEQADMDRARQKDK